MGRHIYRITIAGGLGEVGREAFSEFQIEANGSDTVLIGGLDQAALYGVLNRILSLGFELVALHRVTDGHGLGRRPSDRAGSVHRGTHDPARSVAYNGIRRSGTAIGLRGITRRR